MIRTTSLSKKNLRRLAGVSAVSFTLVTPGFAGSLPSGGRVTAGDAVIGATGATMTVRQTSRAAVINWGDFSIGEGASVRFDNGSGATLNRVTGEFASRIDGSLTASGSVYLVNSAGIVVGKSGVVQTGGSFIASTHDIADADFLNGGEMTFAGASDASVINAGRIGSLGGDIALIARKVENAGVIAAPGGTAALVSGYEVLVRDGEHAEGKFLVKVGGADTSATNAGRIEATVAELRANGGNVYALAGNTAGLVRATAVNTSGGRIIFDAGETGAVHVEGRVDASSTVAKGGAITATGRDITVKAGSTLDASGTTGGSILIGGDYQGGKNGAVYSPVKLSNAATTLVDSGAVIRADGSSGAGGVIVLWADSHTSFSGAISATGAGGKGGFAEVSGKQTLAYAGTADLRGTTGFGTLLLDPADITISNSGTDAGFAPTGASSNISVVALQAALATADVTVTTSSGAGGTGNIIVADGINWSSASVLTLNADNNIVLNAGISASSGGLTLIAKGTGQDVSNGTITTGSAGTINIGGVFTLQQGTWRQVGALPAFHAKDFRIKGNVAADAAKTAFFLRFAGGNGASESGAYQIADIYGLQGIAGGETNGASTSSPMNAPTLGSSSIVRFYALNADVDASITSAWNGGSGFRPIGGVGSATPVIGSFNSAAGGKSFWGTFDGAGHAVAGLVINRTSDSMVGLFGYAKNATIKNLLLKTPRITGNTASTAGVASVGALLAAGNQVTISGVVITGAVVAGGNFTGGLFGQFGSTSGNSKITDCSFKGSVSGTSSVGGLIGQSAASGSAEITRCFVDATIMATGDSIGGLFGNLGQSSITDSYATGSVSGRDNVGGLVGQNSDGTITSCYSTAAVSGSGNNIAGLVGASGAVAIKSYWNIETSGQSVGMKDGVGGSVSGGATGLTSAQMKVQSSFTGFDFTNVWNAPTDSVTPTLKVFDAPVITNITYAFSGAANWGYGDAPILSGAGGANFTLNGVADADGANVAGIIGATKRGGVTTVALSRLLGAGDYTLSLTGLSGSASSKYAISDAGNMTGTLTIAPALLTIIAEDKAKTYGDSAGLTYRFDSTQLKNGDKVDSVALTSAGQTAGAAVVTGGYAITPSGATGAQFDANNYDITYSLGTLTVNKAPLTITADDKTKTYGDDAVLTYRIDSTQLKNGDTVDSVALTSAGREAGADVLAGGYAITASNAAGAQFDANNYDTVYTSGTLTVNKASLTLRANDAVKTFGQTGTLDGMTGFSATGLKNGNSISSVSLSSDGVPSSAAVGVYDILISNATGANGFNPENYDLSYVKGSYAVEAQNAIRYVVGNVFATYGTASPLGSASLIGVAEGDDVQGVLELRKDGVTVTYAATLAVGDYSIWVTSLSGEHGGKYAIAQTGNTLGVLSIGRLNISIGSSATLETTKVYDGLLTAHIATHGALSDAVSGDDVALSLSARFADKNAGTDKSVTGVYALSGAASGNYNLTGDTAFTGTQTILSKEITRTGSVVVETAKVYDGTVNAALGPAGGIDGIIGADDVTLGASATFADKHAGADKTISGAYALTGADAGNYVLSGDTSFGGIQTISAKSITVATAGVVAGKVYDGTISATAASNGSLSGVITGDSVTLTLGGLSFADKNVGAGKIVTGAYSLTGVDAGDYSFGDTAFTGAAAITPQTLVFSRSGAVETTKVYDRTTGIRITDNGALGGVIAGEALTLTLSAQYADKNAGAGKSVSGSYALSGADAGNYTLAATAFSATADITKAPLTLASGATVAGTKIYDTTTGVEITASGSIGGAIAGDTVSLGLNAAAYADANVGAGKIITGTYALTGADAANYTLANTGFSATADITPATLTYSSNPAERFAGAENPVFAGTITGFVGGETLATATSGAVAFTSDADANSPAGRYAINGGGLAATNYVFEQAGSNAAALTVRGVTAGGVPLPNRAELARIIELHPILPASPPPSVAVPPVGSVRIAPEAISPKHGEPESGGVVHPDNRRIGPNLIFVSKN